MKSSPINQAMQSQLVIMTQFLEDMLCNTYEAQNDLQKGNRNAAIGALLATAEGFEHLITLYDAILVMHRHAALVEREEE